MKKLLAGILCLAMLITALPLTAHASKETDELCRKIESDYSRILAATEMESLNGHCGMMVGWQLYLIGVNKELIKGNGNEQYDNYRDMAMTSGGHIVKDYPIDKYETLLDALNAATYYGQKNAYNLLVGFEKTNSEDGREFGHACVIYGIINGMVYYAESYPMGDIPEGQALCRSMESFAASYESWAVYEGMVEFGKRTGDRDEDAVDLYVKVLKETPLYIKMDPESAVMRTLHSGERLHALHLTEKNGIHYYQIDEGDHYGYLPAAAVEVFCTGPEDVTISDEDLPQFLETGSTYEISGTVAAYIGKMEKLRLSVIKNGQTVLKAETDNCGKKVNLGKKEWQLPWETLPSGNYTVQITVRVRQPGTILGLPVSRWETCTLYKGPLTVAEKLRTEPITRDEDIPSHPNGWSLDGEQWYLWSEGKPVTGWYKENGTWYYLLEDGAAVTGEQEIGGILHGFTLTGALRTGWEVTYSGTRYYGQNGVAATSWQTIDGRNYAFGRDGYLVRNDFTEDGLHYADEDGVLAEGWVETAEGKFFCIGGKITAELIGKGKNAVLHFPVLDLMTK